MVPNPETDAAPEAFCELCDLPLKQCSHSMDGPALVFVSSGGDCFHGTSQCPALSEGQKIAAGMGLRTHEIRNVAMARAVEMGRERCSVCFRKSPGKTSSVPSFFLLMDGFIDEGRRVMSNETDVAKVVDRINEEMPAGTWPVWPGGWKDDVEAALLDSIFSIRARYGGESTGVRAVVKNWRQHRGNNRDDLGALAELVGEEEKLFRILKNRQRLGSGPSKAAAAASAASALLGAGVTSSGDVEGTDDQRRAWCSVTGLGDVTWSYFQMLLGVQGVKADVMVTRFVADALGRKTVPSQQARELVLKAAERMKVDATDLDHAIWSWQRKQRRKAR